MKARESIKHEDYLRSIFGKYAFLLFTIDKVLSLMCKSLQNFMNDEFSKLLLGQYVNVQ